MLSTNLTSRLDFACYVQVVANYVLAFDLAMQQDFDVIVLPPAEKIDDFSTAEFVNMVTSAQDSYSVIIPTVDHDSDSHVSGQTVRSAKTGGYLVEDLTAAITSAHNRKTPSVERDRKRSRQDGQTEVATQDQAHPSHNKLARTLQGNTHHGSYSPSYSDPRYADEIAYWQYCQWQWQWQLYYQSQGQLQVDPGFSNLSQALSHASTASNHPQPYQEYRHPSPYSFHSHPFSSSHPAPLMHSLHPTQSIPHLPQPSLTVRYPARNQRTSSCSSVTTEESSTSSSDLVPTITTTTTRSVLARAARSDTDSSSSTARTTTDSLDSAENAANSASSNNNYTDIDIDIVDFDEYMFSIQ